MNSRPEFGNASTGLFAAAGSKDRETLGEDAFHRMISIERRRTERSRKTFLLMLLDMGDHATKNNRPVLHKVLSTLSQMLRETDVAGWYKEDSVVGVMFTEITLDKEKSIPATMMSRVTHTLKSRLTLQQFQQVGISFHLLPEVHNHGVSSHDSIPAIYPGVGSTNGATETSL